MDELPMETALNLARLCVTEGCPWALSPQMCCIEGNQRRGCVSREEIPLSCANEKDASIQRAMYGRSPSMQLSHNLYLDGWSRHHDTKSCLQTIALATHTFGASKVPHKLF